MQCDCMTNKRLLDKRQYWLLILSKLSCRGPERFDPERAEYIRNAARLALVPNSETSEAIFRGQALLCFARALAAESEAGESLTALEEGFLDILGDKSSLPALAASLPRRDQALWAARELTKVMGPGFADACHRALLTKDRPDPAPSAAALRAAAALLRAGLMPKSPALAQCLATRAAMAVSTAAEFAELDQDGDDEEARLEAEERAAASSVLAELLRAPAGLLVHSLTESLQEHAVNPLGDRQAAETLDYEVPELEAVATLSALAKVPGLDAQGTAYERCTRRLLREACDGRSIEMLTAEIRTSTTLALKAPGLAKGQSELIKDLLQQVSDAEMHCVLLCELNRLLPHTGPSALGQLWSWAKNHSPNADADCRSPMRKAAVSAVSLCADMMQTADSASFDDSMTNLESPDRSREGWQTLDQLAWAQVSYALLGSTEEYGSCSQPQKRRRRQQDQSQKGAPSAKDVHALMSRGQEASDPDWHIAVVSLTLEVCRTDSRTNSKACEALLMQALRWLCAHLQSMQSQGMVQQTLTSQVQDWLQGRFSQRLRTMLDSWQAAGSCHCQQMLSLLDGDWQLSPLTGQLQASVLRAFVKLPDLLASASWSGRAWRPWPSGLRPLAVQWWQSLLSSAGSSSLDWRQEVLNRFLNYVTGCRNLLARAGRTYRCLFRLAAMASSHGLADAARELLIDGRLGTCRATPEQQDVLVNLRHLVSEHGSLESQDLPIAPGAHGLLPRAARSILQLKRCRSLLHLQPGVQAGSNEELQAAKRELASLSCNPLLPCSSQAAFRCWLILAEVLCQALDQEASLNLDHLLRQLQAACTEASPLAAARLQEALAWLEPLDKENLPPAASQLEEMLPLPRAVFGAAKGLEVKLTLRIECFVDATAATEGEIARCALHVRGEPTGIPLAAGDALSRQFAEIWHDTIFALSSADTGHVLDSWSVEQTLTSSDNSCLLPGMMPVTSTRLLDTKDKSVYVKAEFRDSHGRCLAVGGKDIDITYSATDAEERLRQGVVSC
eukprot:TRINITY_DN32781_c0_g1_i1.p1 TRINITY_DN32781_c0_g1~~TRINITY_DN32781_c0_g1_i1.p1  ORF type:complete len:1016 (+),score=197.14 TRINITY_DN32781_c0_g1_i1:61-3108(+)